MFIKSYDVRRVDMKKGIVEVQLENGEIVSYPFQLIGVKNMTIN